MAKIHTIRKEPLTAAIKALVRGFGSEPREVDLVTENLIQANLTGHDSHGIGMLPKYSEAFVEGGLTANAHVKTTLDGGAMLRLDGQAGFGQVIGHEAMEMGIARAKQFGSCIVALGNSHHLCRIGAWAEMAIEANLISVHFTNVISRPIVAPFDRRAFAARIARLLDERRPVYLVESPRDREVGFAGELRAAAREDFAAIPVARRGDFVLLRLRTAPATGRESPAGS